MEKIMNVSNKPRRLGSHARAHARLRGHGFEAGDAARAFSQAAYVLLRANAYGEIADLVSGDWYPRSALDIERHGQAVAELRKELKALSRVLLLAESHFRHVTTKRRKRASLAVR